MNHLAGLRLGEPSWRAIWSMRPGCVSSASLRRNLAILLAQLVEHLLLALDAVAALDGVEVLQAIDHDEREEHGDGGGEKTRISRTRTGSEALTRRELSKCLAK